jgi:hypothetical protein
LGEINTASQLFITQRAWPFLANHGPSKYSYFRITRNAWEQYSGQLIMVDLNYPGLADIEFLFRFRDASPTSWPLAPSSSQNYFTPLNFSKMQTIERQISPVI